jgi:hypothetical protein
MCFKKVGGVEIRELVRKQRPVIKKNDDGLGMK